MLKDLVSYVALFQRYLGARIYLSAVFASLASFAEGIGILMLLPLIKTANANLNTEPTSIAETDGIESYLFGVFEFLQLEPTLPVVLIFVTTAFLVKGVMTFAVLAYSAKLNAELYGQLKSGLFQKYIEMRFEYFTKKNTGYFTGLINDQPQKSVISFECLTNLGASAINVVLLVGFAFTVAWQFGLMILVVGGLIWALFRSLNIFVQGLSRKSSEQDLILARWLVQIFQSFKYLSAIGKRDVFLGRVLHIIDLVRVISLKHKLATAFTVSVREPFAVVCIMIVVLVQTVFLGNPIEPLFIAIVLFYRGLNALLACQANWVATLAHVGSFEMIHKEMSQQLVNVEGKGQSNCLPKSSDIAFKDVKFRFEENGAPVLNGISFKVPTKASVAIVGPSGAGKTTILDLITLLADCSEGQVVVGGVNAKNINKNEWRKKIGYVSQEPTIFDDTIFNNITLWASESGDARDLQSRAIKAAQDANIHDVIEGLPEKYQTFVGDRGVRLSGGEKQRLAIARELFRNPEILILDEATSALDSVSERIIQTNLGKLLGTFTMITVAHRLATVKSADNVLVLDQGRVVEAGTFDELSEKDATLFADMLSVQKL